MPATVIGIGPFEAKHSRAIGDGARESGKSLQPGVVGGDELLGFMELAGGLAQLVEVVIDVGKTAGREPNDLRFGRQGL